MVNPDNHFESVVCNQCGSDEYEVLFTSTLTADDLKHGHADYSISQKSSHCGQIIRCKKCTLVYVNPREKLRNIFSSYALVRDEEYLAEEKGRRKTFLRGLRLLERYCPRKGSVLDVGCFTGLFLDLARENGWHSMGVELSYWATRYAREKLDLNVAQGTFEDIKKNPLFSNMWRKYNKEKSSDKKLEKKQESKF